LISRRGA